MDSGDGKRAKMNPKELRFSQFDIAPYLKTRKHPTVEEAVDLIKRGALNPDNIGELTVHKDSEDVVWCKNNRSLYVLRKAGVNSSVTVKFISNDYFVRRLKENVKVKLKDPAFLPSIRGVATSSSFGGKPNVSYPIVEEVREEPKDPAFMPKSRGGATSSPSSQPQSREEENELSSLGILSALSTVVAVGFAAWKIFMGL